MAFESIVEHANMRPPAYLQALQFYGPVAITIYADG